jgi:hypothetical protein
MSNREAKPAKLPKKKKVDPTMCLSAPAKEKMIAFYFDNLGEGEYNCKQDKCRTRNPYKSKNGFTNLFNHLERCVGADFVDKYLLERENSDLSQQTSITQFVNACAQHCYVWIKYIIMTSKPLSDVDNPFIRELGEKHGTVCSTTIKKNILALHQLVKVRMGKYLPEHFVLVFDGWTCGSTHFIAIIACFLKTRDGKSSSSTKDTNFCEMVLSISPFLDERQMNANEHFKLLDFTVRSYGKDLKKM